VGRADHGGQLAGGGDCPDAKKNRWSHAVRNPHGLVRRAVNGGGVAWGVKGRVGKHLGGEGRLEPLTEGTVEKFRL